MCPWACPGAVVVRCHGSRAGPADWPRSVERAARADHHPTRCQAWPTTALSGQPTWRRPSPECRCAGCSSASGCRSKKTLVTGERDLRAYAVMNCALRRSRRTANRLGGRCPRHSAGLYAPFTLDRSRPFHSGIAPKPLPFFPSQLPSGFQTPGGRLRWIDPGDARVVGSADDVSDHLASHLPPRGHSCATEFLES